MRGATLLVAGWPHLPTISIHAPHAGGDGVAQLMAFGMPEISIHAPHAGGDGALLSPLDAE